MISEREQNLNDRARALLAVAEAEPDTVIGVACLARCQEIQGMSMALCLLRLNGFPQEPSQ